MRKETERNRKSDLLLKIGLGIFYTGLTIAAITLASSLGKMAGEYVNKGTETINNKVDHRYTTSQPVEDYKPSQK